MQSKILISSKRGAKCGLQQAGPFVRRWIVRLFFILTVYFRTILVNPLIRYVVSSQESNILHSLQSINTTCTLRNLAKTLVTAVCNIVCSKTTQVNRFVQPVEPYCLSRYLIFVAMKPACICYQGLGEVSSQANSRHPLLIL